MSLLLDALKNAALEKQRRDQAQAGQSLSESGSHKKIPQPDNITTHDESNKKRQDAMATAPAIDSSKATFDAASSEELNLEGLDEVPSVEFNLQGIDEAPLEFDLEAIEESYLLDVKDKTARKPDTLSSRATPEEPSEVPTLLPTAPKEPEVHKPVPSPSATAESMSGHGNLTRKAASEEVEAKTTAPHSDLDSQATEFDVNSGKDALNRLLSRSNQATKVARKRWVAIYALFTLTSVSLIAVYYYLLNDNTNVITPLALDTVSVSPATTPEISEAISGIDQVTDDNEALAESAPIAMIVETPNEELPKSISTETTPAQDSTSTKLASAGPDSTEPAPTKLAATVVKPAIANKPSIRQTSQGTPSGKDTTPVPSTSSAAGVDRPMNTSREAPEERVSESILRGYQAYQAGDFATAETAYREALAEDPHQRDALLGAAAVAVQFNRYEEALRYYQQRLARAPKDEYAQAGLLALTNSSDNNPQFDSELNRLLREYPDAAHLHFLKGSQYASRQQWGAAQPAFFEAWQRDMQNPDYAFNLAVSMDHLQEAKEAIRFYQKALSLSSGRQAGFSPSAVQERIQALETLAP